MKNCHVNNNLIIFIATGLFFAACDSGSLQMQGSNVSTAAANSSESGNSPSPNGNPPAINEDKVVDKSGKSKLDEPKVEGRVGSLPPAAAKADSKPELKVDFLNESAGSLQVGIDSEPQENVALDWNLPTGMVLISEPMKIKPNSADKTDGIYVLQIPLPSSESLNLVAPEPDFSQLCVLLLAETVPMQRIAFRPEVLVIQGGVAELKTKYLGIFAFANCGKTPMPSYKTGLPTGIDAEPVAEWSAYTKSRSINDSLVDSNGKIIAVGTEGDITQGFAVPNWSIFRFNSDGSLDSSFEANSAILGQLKGAAMSVAKAGDSIYILGHTATSTDFGTWRSAMIRLVGEDRHIDLTFGTAGIYRFSTANSQEITHKITTDEDQNLYVAIEGSPSVGTKIFKFDSSGKLMMSWPRTLRNILYPQSIVADNSGVYICSNETITKLNPSGVIDTSFGSAGYFSLSDVIVTDGSCIRSCMDIALNRKQARLVAAISAYSCGGSPLEGGYIAGIKKDSGTLDKTFGASVGESQLGFNQIETLNTKTVSFFGLALDSFGRSYVEAYTSGKFTLMRFDAKGYFDKALWPIPTGYTAPRYVGYPSITGFKYGGGSVTVDDFNRVIIGGYQQLRP